MVLGAAHRPSSLLHLAGGQADFSKSKSGETGRAAECSEESLPLRFITLGGETLRFKTQNFAANSQIESECGQKMSENSSNSLVCLPVWPAARAAQSPSAPPPASAPGRRRSGP